MADENDTREKILTAAKAIVSAGGAGKLTFDAVARQLGITKQAVIYWFPRKEDLVAGVAVPALREEAETALRAMKAAPDEIEAVRAYVRAVAAFHFADLDRFRLMYIAPLMGTRPGVTMSGSLGDQIHALTSSIYDELQAQLQRGRGLSKTEARRAAVAIDMAVLGLVMMVAMTDAMGDPLLHDRNDMVEAMAKLLSGRTGEAAD